MACSWRHSCGLKSGHAGSAGSVSIWAVAGKSVAAGMPGAMSDIKALTTITKFLHIHKTSGKLSDTRIHVGMQKLQFK